MTSGGLNGYNSGMRMATYAMRSEDSRGRRYPERPHPYRSDYQRDRDRIIHTKAFRRLEKKTQVFAPSYSDHFRNRLTHTIEVAQITRTIGRALGLNSDLCEVLALSHDIGHPPFSHEGERVLDQIMKTHGSGFEHNLHALRIVEDFEEKYPAFRGLNLTFEVREGIVKHSRDYQSGEVAYIDLSEYRLSERPPMEAQLIDIADEIAYNCADLDDGFLSGLLSLDLLVREVELFRILWEEVGIEFPSSPEKLRFNEVIRRMIDFLVSRLIHFTRRTIEDFDLWSVEDVRSSSCRVVRFDEEAGGMNRQLKQFLRNHLYNHPVLKQALDTVEMELSGLFDYYLRFPERLPSRHRERIEILGLPRVVCDYIAGMTDSYARDRYNETCASRCGQTSIS